MAKIPKKRNPQDSTLRNVRAMLKKFEALRTKVTNLGLAGGPQSQMLSELMQRMSAVERRLGRLEKACR
jgi:hypothetical protein